jgi:hypothetical protein
MQVHTSIRTYIILYHLRLRTHQGGREGRMFAHSRSGSALCGVPGTMIVVLARFTGRCRMIPPPGECG